MCLKLPVLLVVLGIARFSQATICQDPGKSRKYAGTVSVTMNNYQCQSWSSQSPQSHATVGVKDSDFPVDGSVAAAKNYCRDPDNSGYLWCYTTNPDVRWEACAVSSCEPCYTSPCQNGAQCSNVNNVAACTCTAGYTGSTCGTSLDPCTSSPCQNGGACTKTSGTTFTCGCTAGFTGVTCSSVADPCSSSPCKNGATCSKTSATTFTCSCTGDYTGNTCQTMIDPCTSSPCLNGGTCVRVSSTDFQCFCVPDYDDGDTCAQYQDPCTSSPCLNGGKCSRSSSLTFSCVCSSSYIGNFCELKKGVQPCDNSPCQHGGTCTLASSTTYSCKCTTQYEGTMCEKLICINNPTTDCDLVGTVYGMYGYCGNCTLWAVCKAKKRKVRSCASRAPNVYFNRATKNCTATTAACTGLLGI